MKRLTNFLVEKSKIILVIFLLITLVSVWLMTKVTVNGDMTEYLPEDSTTKIGLAIMEEEFPNSQNISTFRVMFEDVSAEKALEIYTELSALENVAAIGYEPGSEAYNKDGNVLYEITVNAPALSDEVFSVRDAIKENYSDYDFELYGDALGNETDSILIKIVPYALIILVLILFAMCDSWVEPLLFLATIAVAVVINMGTNVIFKSVSDVTYSIAAILQLCLSMDYSIMLLNRYRQEKKLESDKKAAMKSALAKAITAISSSAITTIVGMLALAFMSFTIGADMGFVLAKGVLLSLICIFTVLPALILIFDKAIDKSAKKSLHIKMDGIASLSVKARKIIPIVFVLLFIGSFFLKGNVSITYTMSEYYNINKIFPPENQIVLLYENEDEEQIVELAAQWMQREDVKSVSAYSTTIGAQLTDTQLAYTLGVDAEMIAQLFGYYGMMTGSAVQSMSLAEFVDFVVEYVAESEQFAQYMTPELSGQLAGAKAELEAGVSSLVGENYSMLLLVSALPEESEATTAFFDEFYASLDGALSGEYYAIGNAAMAYEMSESFPGEMDLITILTAVAIFIVVMIAFKSISIPVILVLIIQCAIFITMGSVYVFGSSIYYLPLLVVQCLLMGATVDYGILLTSYYREFRAEKNRKDALASALNGAIHTIMTSSLILILVTGVLGVLVQNSQPSISEILLIIARGGLCATVLVVFILPGLLAAFDRFVCKNRFEEK